MLPVVLVSTGSILKLVNGLASTPVHHYLRRSTHTPLKPAENHVFRLPQRTQRDTQPHIAPHTTTQRWRPYDHAHIRLPWQLAISCRPRRRCWWLRGCCVSSSSSDARTVSRAAAAVRCASSTQCRRRGGWGLVEDIPPVSTSFYGVQYGVE